MAILKGKYRVKNSNNNYDIVYLETSASQVKFDDGKTFQEKLNNGTLKGDKGDKGEQGVKGDKGDKGNDGLTTSVTVGSTKYTHSNGNITIPAYPTLSSLGAAASSHTHSAYVNQNAFSNVKVGSTTVSADSATDTLELKAGSNIVLTPDTTNDAVTIAVNGLTVTSSEKSTWNSKETTSGSQAKADAALASAKSYTDTKVANLVGSAPEALDTLQELAAAIQDNEAGVTDLLTKVGTKAEKSYVDTELSKKANSSHTHTGSQVTLTGYSKPSSTSAVATTDTINAAIGKLEKALDGKQASGSYASSSHNHDSAYLGKTATAAAATKLATARTINGVSFDGTANITITDSTKVAPTGTIVANRVAVFNDTTGKVIKDSGFTIATSVPSGAKFTDTIYTHPSTHDASMIVQSSSYRFVTDAEKENWNSKSGISLGTTSSTAFRGDYGNTAYTHSQSAHAPSNAQKNSDITKAEIEAKLTGTITSHNHTIANITDLRLKNGVSGITIADPYQTWVSADINKNDIIFGGNYSGHTTTDANIVFSSGNGKINMVIDGEYYAAEGKQRVYHTGYKPTPADIGAATSSHTHSYLPLSGGTITSSEFAPFKITRSGNTYAASIGFSNSSGVLGFIGMTGVKDGGLMRWSSDTTTSSSGTSYTILDTGNYKTHVTPANIGAATSSHTHNYAGSSSAGGAATSANKVNTNLVVKLNGGSTEGTNLFTFNGSAAKTVNITPSSIGATRKYSANIGDGSATTIKVTHNLGTEDITVSVREVSTKQIVFADVQIVDTNSINILFNSAPTSAQYRVVVIG